MSDLFDSEAQQSRRPDETASADEHEVRAPPEDGPPEAGAVGEPEAEPPKPSRDEPASSAGEEPPPYRHETRSSAPEERRDQVSWPRADDEGWPQRPEPPPAAPPPRTGLNPLVRLGVPQPWRAIIDWIVTIAGAIAIVLAIKAWVVNPYRIPSSSMEPTLHCAQAEAGCTSRFSDRVLANRFIYHFRDPRRGEIVVFNVPAAANAACGAGGVFVKRIIGLPGDTWQERNGFVYINGKKLDEPYVKKDRRDFQSWPLRRIPKDSYFMMGDNRQSSCDSRRWGPVPRKNIIGKVFAIYWPPQRIRLL